MKPGIAGLVCLFAALSVPPGIEARVSAGELALFGKLPDPGKDWLKENDGSSQDGAYSWVHFVHAPSGDVLAFVAWNAPGLKVDGAPVRQASIETFTHDGYARMSRQAPGEPIAETIRNQLVSIGITNQNAKQKFDTRAIEFSYVYESQRGAAPTLAHGYVAVVGDVTVFIQHTSKHVTTSELAADMLFGILSRHLADATSLRGGWGLGIRRGRK